MSNKPLLTYFGHHKCASRWITGIVLSICRSLGLKAAIVHSLQMFNGDLKRHVKQNSIDFLCYTNADIRYVKALDRIKAFHVVRDPRDIVVSAYFSHLYSHASDNWPVLVEHRKKLKTVTKEEGLLLEMKFREHQFHTLYAWNYSQPNILEIKMEDLIKNPYETFVEIFRFLQLVDETSDAVKKQIIYLFVSIMNKLHAKSYGLIPFHYHIKKISLQQLLFTVYNNRFSKKAQGRHPGEENIKDHYRKGITGDWHNHFNEDHRRYFKENFNDVLVKLGYESDLNW